MNRMWIFIVIYGGLLGSFITWIAWIITRRGNFSLITRRGMGGLGLATWLILMSSQWFYRMSGPSTPINEVFQYGSALLLGFFAFAIFFFIPIDLLQRAWTRFDPQKRVFLNRTMVGSLLGLTGAATIGGWLESMRGPQIKEVMVRIKNLPIEFEGYTIAQASDVHIGPTLHRDFLARVVKSLNEVGADAVAITGDLVDGTPAQLAEHVEPLRDLRAKDGVFFVTGNHEYYWDANAWYDKVESLGLIPLKNQNRLIHRGSASLMMAGVYDLSAHRMIPEHISSPREAIRSESPAHVKVLLAHQPKSIYEAAEAGFDLQLSGHTHAGQFYPWKWLVHLAQPYVGGLHLHEQKTWIYVNAGTGYWGTQMRLGVPQEITVIRLQRA